MIYIFFKQKSGAPAKTVSDFFPMPLNKPLEYSHG